MIKLLIGGSPCVFWSVAQHNNRETEASGNGWELFKNYLIAMQRFRPDYFLFENNMSISPDIKREIKKELGVTIEESQLSPFSIGAGARYIEINSALVSAQTRKRFYIHNCGNVKQPTDRGIIMQDILESGLSYVDKTSCLTSTYYKGDSVKHALLKSKRPMVAEPIQVGALPRPNGELSTSQGFRIYSTKGKSVTLKGNAGGCGGKTGLYAIPTETDVNNNIYEVKDGLISIRGGRYPIKLPDGHYIIRKLTPTECCRLQTMPDDYCRAVSNTQALKCLGNGWTAEVIIHILHEALKDVPKDEEIVVLSMYDGIGTGRYCLDKMGFTNIKYYAYEIDKYAIKVATSNYPDIIECGDAFQLREDTWKLN